MYMYWVELCDRMVITPWKWLWHFPVHYVQMIDDKTDHV
jgi:hypothetical protein